MHKNLSKKVRSGWKQKRQRVQKDTKGTIKAQWSSKISVVGKIETVEDLGKSGSISGNRDNYELLLKRIDRGEIGAIFYHDQSRLSRNPLDFHFLMAKCRIHDTLFVEDGRLLDPKDATDSFMASIRADVAQLENLDRTKKMQDGAVARVKSGFAVRRFQSDTLKVKKANGKNIRNKGSEIPST